MEPWQETFIINKSSLQSSRRVFIAEFKVMMVLTALRDDKALAHLCQQYELHPAQITDCKKELQTWASDVFDSSGRVDVDLLHTKIEQQALVIGFFRRRAHQSGVADRKQMIDPSHPLSISCEAKLLNMSRGPACYVPKPVSNSFLTVMNKLTSCTSTTPSRCPDSCSRSCKADGSKWDACIVDAEAKHHDHCTSTRHQTTHPVGLCVIPPDAQVEHQPQQSNLGALYDIFSDAKGLCLPDGGGRCPQP